MKQNIVKAVKCLIYLTFFVPLLVFPASFIFPFIVPKILMFRSLVELMIGGYILLLCINWQEFKPKFSWLNVAMAAFFASFAISTFTGVDPYHSFWDNHERMLGLFTIFHYVAYYLICCSLFKTWDDWKKALRVFLVAGTLAMVVGLIQVFKPNLLLNQGNARVASTLGNPIYVGGYGLFLTFVAVLLFFRREKDQLWKWLTIGMGALAIVITFYSGTRGSMLGLFAGFGVMILGYILVLKEQKKLRLALVGVAVAGVALVGLLYAFRQTQFVSNIPALGRAVNTTYTALKNTPRWIAWGVAVKSWEQHPIFGWGPNNFFYAFNNNYNPKSLLYGYGETWFDNAHNVIMNTLAVQGMVGLVTYLFIFVAGIISVVVMYKRGGLNMHVAVIGPAFLIAHLVQNVTVFENPTSYLYFMFWLAMISQMNKAASITAEAKTGTQKPVVSSDKKVSGGAMSVVGLVVILLIFIFNVQPARANIKTLNALKMLTYAPGQGVGNVKEALAFNSPHIDDIRSDLGRTMAQLLASPENKLGKEQSLEIFSLAETALLENTRLHPLDIRNYLSLSQLYQIGFSLTNDAKYITEYGRNLTLALQYSPKRQQIMYNLANFYLQTNQLDMAVKLLEETITDVKEVSESYWRLAYLYKLSGKPEKAKEVLDLAEQNKVQFSESEKNIIQEILGTPSITNI